MRKFNGIVFDKVEPKDSEVLWLNSNGLFVCENGVWINVYKGLIKDLETLDFEINQPNEGIAATVYSISSTVNDMLDESNQSSVVSRLTALEESVFTEDTPDSEEVPEQND